MLLEFCNKKYLLVCAEWTSLHLPDIKLYILSINLVQYSMQKMSYRCKVGEKGLGSISNALTKCLLFCLVKNVLQNCQASS